jgi:hypothetical protein
MSLPVYLRNFFLYTTILLILSGCRTLPFKVPENFAQNAIATRLASQDPHVRSAAYSEAFPALSKTQMDGEILLNGSFWKGPLQANFFALDRGNLRLRAEGTVVNQRITAFDLMILDNVMSIYVPTDKGEGVIYNGSLPPEGSPFGQHFGIEPGDLISIFRIGELVAHDVYKIKRYRKTTKLIHNSHQRVTDDVEPLEYPASIILDNASGLPRRAIWKRDHRNYIVEYKSWKYFNDKDGSAPSRLFPEEVRVRRRWRGYIDLTAYGYRFGGQPPEAVFKFGHRNAIEVPLAELNRAFGSR